MNHFPLQIDKQQCNQCKQCVTACSFMAIHLSDFPHINQDNCRLCGRCVKACPTHALKILKHPTKRLNHSEGIWVLIDHCNNEIEPVSLQLLSKAYQLASISKEPVTAIIFGQLTPTVEDSLFRYGASKIHLVQDPRYINRIEEDYSNTLSSLIKEHAPSIFLIGATDWGRSIAARVAATVETGLTADCTSLTLEPDTHLLLQQRPAFGGQLMATIKCAHQRPQMATVRPNVFQAIQHQTKTIGEVIITEALESHFDQRISTLSQSPISKTTHTLQEADFVIGIGRGVKTAATVDLIKQLAIKLNARIAGSRGAVEMGAISANDQIGQTGSTITANTYIALGISGQIQHTAAITGCEKIIAINKDKQAPIFNYADYGFVGDIDEIIKDMLTQLSENETCLL